HTVQTMKIGDHHTFTYRVKAKNGEELWIRSYTYKYGEQGVPNMLCFCMDISDIIEMENQLKQQKTQLEFATAEMQTIISNIPGGVHRCPLFGRIYVNYVSQGFEELSGYTQAEIHALFNDTYTMLLLEEDRDAFADAMRQLAREPGKRTLTYRLRRKDGSIIRVVDHFRSLRMEDGNVWGFGVATDVTTQYETLARLQLLTDSIPGGLVVYESTPAGINLIYFSDGVCGMVGYTREEYAALAETNIAYFVWEEDRTLLRSKIAELGTDAGTVDCVYRHRTKSGGYRWLNIRGTVADRWGDSVRINAVLLDITESKELEEKLRIRDQEYSLAIAQSGKAVYRYTVADQSVYMLQKAANPFEFPIKAENVPESLIALDLIAPESVDDFVGFYAAISRGEKTGSITLRRRLKSGDFGWCLARFTTLFSSSGSPISAIISIDDITRQHEQELENETLRQNEALFQAVVSHSDRFIVKYDIKTKTAFLQPRTAEAFSVGSVLHNVPDCWKGQAWLAKESQRVCEDFYGKLMRGVPTVKAILKILKNKKGDWDWYRFDGSVIFDDKKRPSYAVISFVEITKQYEKELAYERMSQRVNRLSKDAMLYFETNLTKLKITHAGGAELGCLRHGLEGEPSVLLENAIQELIEPKNRDVMRRFFSRGRMLSDFADGMTEKKIEMRILCNSHPKWIRITVELITDPYTEDVLAYVLFRDIDEAKMEEMRIQREAETDGLTGLYNRSSVERQIKQVLAEKRGKGCAFVIIDVDDLKTVNDTLGHMQGDRAIQAFADILRDCFGGEALVGRIGGDEFLAFLQGSDNVCALKDRLHTLIYQLSALRVGEREDYPLHGSIGVAMSDTDDFAALYKKADAALYYVKRHGKNNYAFYTSDMHMQRPAD
ncbi:MAG: PAS domain-containing protein, partial [Oscillospiraceae bacterium]